MSVKQSIKVTNAGLSPILSVAQGTGAIEYEFTVSDFDIPSGSAAVAYNIQPTGNIVSQTCSISGNTITIKPPAYYFLRGKNYMQFQVSRSNEDLFSFLIEVWCAPNISQPEVIVAENPSLVSQLISDVGLLSSQLDNLLSIPSGSLSTSADAALADIKVGWDGTTYDTPGDAVRGQIGELNDDLDNINSFERINLFDKNDVTIGKFRGEAVGQKFTDIYDSSNWCAYNKKIPVKNGDVVYINFNYTGLLLYNENDVCIKVFDAGTNLEFIIDDDNAKYVCFNRQNYDNYFLNNFMISVNIPLPTNYIGYKEYKLKDSNIFIDANEQCFLQSSEYLDINSRNIDCIIHDNKYVNIFNPQNISIGKYFVTNIGSSDEEFYYNEESFCCNDKFACRKGDKIYISINYANITIYDRHGKCVQVADTSTDKVIEVASENAYYFRYASVKQGAYLDGFMLSVNTELPSHYVPYGVSWNEYKNNVEFYKPKIIISVDYSFPDISSPHVTYGLENGIRFVFNGQGDNARYLLKRGCELGTYSNESLYLPDFSTINSESEEDLQAWDNYVRHALHLQESKGFVKPVLWECRQLQYGTALEKALKKNGYIYARGGNSSNGFYPIKNVNYQRFDCIVPTDITIDSVKNAINICVSRSKTLCILFHRVLDEVPSGNTWDISTTYYKQIIDYILQLINDEKIIVVTPNELYNLSNPKNAHVRDTIKLLNLIN